MGTAPWSHHSALPQQVVFKHITAILEWMFPEPWEPRFVGTRFVGMSRAWPQAGHPGSTSARHLACPAARMLEFGRGVWSKPPGPRGTARPRLAPFSLSILGQQWALLEAHGILLTSGPTINLQHSKSLLIVKHLQDFWIEKEALQKSAF